MTVLLIQLLILSFFNSGIDPILENRSLIILSLSISFSISIIDSDFFFFSFNKVIHPIIEVKGVPI